MVKVSAVSYINTYPFLYGIEHSPIADQVSLSLDVPSETARKLLNDEVDLALVPVVVIPLQKSLKIVSDYCIASDGPVQTVCLFCDVPVEEIDEIYLDSQSYTSIEMLKILVKDHWNIEVALIERQSGYEDEINGRTAGLIIGDRAIYWRQKFKFEYDLGQVWQAFTSLPFVYAAWVSNKELPDGFMQNFNDALGAGLGNIDRVIMASTHHGPAEDRYMHFHGDNVNFDIEDYLKNKVHFKLDAEKQKGLKYFLSLLPNEETLTVSQALASKSS